MSRESQPVVVLSGIRWDFLWQRHQILASKLAERGHPTIFVETTGLSNPRPAPGLARKLLSRFRNSVASSVSPPAAPENLRVYSPLAAPPTASAFRALNRRVFVPRVVRDLRRLAGHNPAVIAYPPTRTTLDILRELSPSRLLYDCSDNYEGFPGVPADIAHTERELLATADAVSCTSEFLLDKVRPARPDAYLSGPGVDFEAFGTLASEPVSEVRTVCFFGHIGERLDLDALRAVVRAGYTLRLIGETDAAGEKLLREPGVDYRGAVAHEDLPRELAGVDAFVLPYRIDSLTRGINPAKIYECLATGRPVVASPLPALAGMGKHVYLAESAAEFVRRLGELFGRESPRRVAARVELARQNGWERRVEEVERVLWGG